MRAADILSPDQVQAVQAKSTLKGVALIVHAWAVIFGAMALFAWSPNPLTFLLAVALVAGRQLGLSILMHEGAHGLITHRPSASMWLSQWLCAYPVFLDTIAYRKYHLQHHANTQQPDDPDLVLSAPFPITSKSFRRKVIRDLTGQTGVQQRWAQIESALGKSTQPWPERLQNFRTKLGPQLISNAILFAGLSATGHWYLYPLLWLLPLLTVYQLILRIRNIAEHAMVPDDADPFRNARTTLASPIARLFLAPYWVNYHVEHHLLMWVPCYNLSKMHRFLQADPHGDRIEVKRSYAEILRLAVSRTDDGDDGGSRVHTGKRRVTGLIMETDADDTFDHTGRSGEEAA